jgi:ornithine carrier protein
VASATLPSLPSLTVTTATFSSRFPRAVTVPVGMTTFKARRPLLDRKTTDVLSGSFAGVIGKVVEYPFDTIKVRLQCQEISGTQFRGASDCLAHIARHEGLASIYRGISAPLVGSVAENAVLFAAYGGIQKLLKNGSDAPLTVSQLTVAGALAGTVVSFVMTPVELVKCRMQVQRGVTLGPWRSALSELRTNGVRGLFKGHSATMARETVGGAAWFGFYELACNVLAGDRGKDSLTQGQLMFAGSLGGIAYNAILFPADVVKSQVQAESAPGARANYFGRLAKLHAKEGIRGLYRGFGVTLVKAVPANAAIFGTYEYARRHLVMMDTALS